MAEFGGALFSGTGPKNCATGQVRRSQKGDLRLPEPTEFRAQTQRVWKAKGEEILARMNKLASA